MSKNCKKTAIKKKTVEDTDNAADVTSGRDSRNRGLNALTKVIETNFKTFYAKDYFKFDMDMIISNKDAATTLFMHRETSDSEVIRKMIIRTPNLINYKIK